MEAKRRKEEEERRKQDEIDRKNAVSIHCLKNVSHLTCYNYDVCERILIFFGINVTNKVSNQ